MSYLKIKNLYADQTVLLFKEVFCLEKIDGSSSHISFNGEDLQFFSGCAKHEEFLKIFNQEELLSKFKEQFGENQIGVDKITVFGEVYGASVQKMSNTYGKQLRFIAFDIRIGNCWLNVPVAEEICKKLELEFVHYVKASTNLDELNKERDRDSVQGIRNGMGEGHPSEGIIIRPLMEMTLNNGSRVIAKHKKDEFRETNKVRKVVDPAQLEVLTKANEIAEEWCTARRLQHVAGRLLCDIFPANIPQLIKGMFEDIKVEAASEIVWSKEVEKAVGSKTAQLVKQFCKL